MRTHTTTTRDHVADLNTYARVAGAARQPPRPPEPAVQALRTWMDERLAERAAEVDAHHTGLLVERLDAYSHQHAEEPGCRAALRALEAQIRAEHAAIRTERLQELRGDLRLIVHRALDLAV